MLISGASRNKSELPVTAALELGNSGFQVRLLNHSATLPPVYRRRTALLRALALEIEKVSLLKLYHENESPLLMPASYLSFLPQRYVVALRSLAELTCTVLLPCDHSDLEI